MTEDERFMKQAVKLAKKGERKVHPNPMVGAIFVKDGEILSTGYHKKWGGHHAEVEAINAAKKSKINLTGSTLYVTLEPCSHKGKQGPCTEAIKAIKPKIVVYSTIDPNPLVSGKGIKILNKAGIETKHLSINETKELNEIYNINTIEKRPFIHIKTACTQSGYITLEKGHQTPLGNPKSMKRVHELRNKYEGILIGINTLLIDNPRLTTRLKKGKNPVRIIVDTNLRTPHDAQILKEEGGNIIATTHKSPPLFWKKMSNTEILICKSNKNQRVDLQDLLKKLNKKNISSILVEGGESINTSFLNEGLVDKISFIICPQKTTKKNLPQIFKTKENGLIELKNASMKWIDSDLWIEGTPKE
jgi:diaminohydroxyphosphoribosylaminopyrimidine deaminase / 5-amino-6-(5-phosphoribosylamino)uracil reductase